MPRQRKAQSSANRLGTGRVANTTTSTPKLQTVYRVPTGKGGECCGAMYEVTGVSPIRVQIEGENIYRVSLDSDALERVVENMNLDLSNVTLNTINGNVEFTGSVNVDRDLSSTELFTQSLQAYQADIADLVSDDINVQRIRVSDGASMVALSADEAEIGDLKVVNDTIFDGNVSVGGELTAATGTIDTLTSTDATITNLDATSGDITTLTSDSATLGQLDVTGATTVTDITSTGTATLNNVSATGNTTLANVTVNGASTLTGNASVGGNLSVTGNETVTGNLTVTGDGIFSSDVSIAEDLNVSGDATITDDLTVNGSTHLNTFETTGSGSIGGNLSVDGSIAGGSSLVVENQIESGSVVTTNTVTDNLTVNGNIALGNNATAPDFVLQSEKGQPNGVAPLDANGKIDSQYLPPVYTTAIVKMGTGIFNNSNTSLVIDSDITANSFVSLSNYSDIIGDLNEIINEGQITVVSNQTETGSYKYIIVNPIS